nr:MAG TPA: THERMOSTABLE DNA LIGASE [Caudoviricetes sp.]
MSIVSTIQALAATTSRTDKIAILKKADKLFQRFLVAAYDPGVSYGVIQMPDVHGDQDTLETVSGFILDELLPNLASRKLSGRAAQMDIERVLQKLKAEDADVLRNVIRKDLRCGINTGTISAAIKGLIFEPPYMRCSLKDKSNMKKWDWSEGIISQTKADGMFINAIVGVDGVQWMTRNGQTFPEGSLGTVLNSEALRVLKPNHVYMGELLVIENNAVLPREVGNGALNSVLKGGLFEPDQQPILKVWDVVSVDEWRAGSSNYVYNLRMADCKLIPESQVISAINTRVVYDMQDAMAHYRELVANGEEGTILKHPDLLWKDGTSKDAVKLKVEADVDLLVVGFEQGKGKFADMVGSLTCETADGGIRVNVSGFTDGMRKHITENVDQWIGNKVITVRANDIMEADPVSSLFLPRFVEVREDKDTPDTTAKVFEIFAAACR